MLVATPRTVILLVGALVVLAATAGALDTAPASTAAVEPAGQPAGADGGGTLDAADRATAAAAPRTPEDTSAPPTTRSTRLRDPAAPPVRIAPEGWLVAGGRSPVAGTGGPLVTYTVELATSAGRRIGVDGFAAVVTATLSDPENGWTAAGRWRLQRVDDPGAARIRVLLAEPTEVDLLCARAGLDTRGRFSCWDGRIAALNADRWTDGVGHVDDLALYRAYLVNHEVGHGLGYGHEDCPTSGALAPIMMQLTLSTQGCLPNGVPHP